MTIYTGYLREKADKLSHAINLLEGELGYRAAIYALRGEVTSR